MPRIKTMIYAIRLYGIKSFFSNALSILMSDFVIVSFQKCGKTWLRVMLSKALSLKYGIKKIKLDLQFMTMFRPGIPNFLISHAGSTEDNNKVDFTSVFKRKKIIFLVRDPKDIVISLFHGSRTRDLVYDGDDISVFIRDKDCGFEKIINFMNTWAQELRKRNKDFIIVKYEDIKQGPAEQLRRIFEFTGISMPDSIINQSVAFGSFDNMRKMELSSQINDYRMKPGNINDPNSFRTRKGKVGGYKEELNHEDIDYINDYLKECLDPLFGYD